MPYLLTVMLVQARAEDCPWAGLAGHDHDGLKQKPIVFAQIFVEARWVVIHRVVWRHLLSAGDCQRVLEH